MNTVITNEGKELDNISIVFCSDEYLLDINNKYLSHDYYTDVITFNYNQGKIISGDILISIEKKENIVTGKQIGRAHV